jgi:lysozyme
MPSSAPKPPPKGQSAALLALIGLVGVGVAGDLMSDTKADEGVIYRAYGDLGGVWSICSGSTRNVKPGEVDTDDQCDARTAADLMVAAKGVLACAPNLKAPERQQQLRAAVRFNNNTGKFCASSARPLMVAGKYRAGCDALLRYNGIVGRKPIRGAVSVRRLKDGRYFSVIRGLNNRRAHEHSICVSTLP